MKIFLFQHQLKLQTSMLSDHDQLRGKPKSGLLLDKPLQEKKNHRSGFLTRSDTDWTVQLKKQAKSLKFWI